MLVALSWIQEFIDLTLSPEQLSEVLTLAGLEVEKVEEVGSDFSGVVAAKVEKVEPHPDADSLQVATVFDGEERYQVVCGASNCRAGIVTAFAKIGAKLIEPDGKEWKIKKGKLRGVESFGMLCAKNELGLAKESSGIMELPEEIALGSDLRKVLGDVLFEIALTPNLGHCTSILGIARELAALLNLKVKQPSASVNESSHKIDEMLKVEVTDAPRYACRVIRGVKMQPSPEWLVQRLESANMRSINPLVDVTNYVMHEIGQPMHAFDYDKIAGKTVRVAVTEKETSLETLDGQSRKVPRDTLLIWDAEKAIAIAGVMGGANTEVSDETTNIVLEAATFDPRAVRKASKSLGLRSESSGRFEKGTDPNAVILALDRAASLIQSIVGGEIAQSILDFKETSFTKRHLTIRLSRTNALLGTEFILEDIESLLMRLEMEVKKKDADLLDVKIPTYRNDVTSEIDLIEEVARIYGYNNIAKKRPRYTTSNTPHSPLYLIEKETRQKLLGCQLQEFLTCDLISPSLAALAVEKEMPTNSEIEVMRPSSVDQSILRTSLLPGLLQAAKHNADQKEYDISAFEIGRIHFRDGENITERLVAAIVMTGKRGPHFWEDKPGDVDFFDLKGNVERFLEAMHVPSAVFQASSLASLHPNKQASFHIDGRELGALGEVHPQHRLKLDLKRPIYYAQIDLQDLLEVRTQNRQMMPLAQFPGSERDWTITLKKDVPFGTILSAVNAVPSSLLKECTLLDVYESEKLGPDRKNITLRFFYRHDQKTLSMEAVEKEHARIIKGVETALS